MKRITLVMLGILSASIGHADIIRKGSVDVVCTSLDHSRTFRLINNKNGSVLIMNGMRVAEGRQVTAGTEDGPAYMQFYGNKYNVFIESGDFETAVIHSLDIPEGKATAKVFDYFSDTEFQAQCSGSFLFKSSQVSQSSDLFAPVKKKILNPYQGVDFSFVLEKSSELNAKSFTDRLNQFKSKANSLKAINGSPCEVTYTGFENHPKNGSVRVFAKLVCQTESAETAPISDYDYLLELMYEFGSKADVYVTPVLNTNDY